MADKWNVINDEAVRHIWIDTAGKTHAVGPEYYEQNGEPFDNEADEQMAYHNTEVNVSALDHKLAVIAAAFRESDMFYKPMSKEDAEKWLALMAQRQTEIGLGFMVGLNYAAEMIKQIIDGTHPGLTPTHVPGAEVPIPAHDATPSEGGDNA